MQSKKRLPDGEESVAPSSEAVMSKLTVIQTSTKTQKMILIRVTSASIGNRALTDRKSDAIQVAARLCAVASSSQLALLEIALLHDSRDNTVQDKLNKRSEKLNLAPAPTP